MAKVKVRRKKTTAMERTIRDLEALLAQWRLIRVDTDFRFCPADVEDLLVRLRRRPR
jgi:hypothetical protein